MDEPVVALKLNLVFFCTHGRQFRDFREIGRRITERAPDIATTVFTTRAAVRPMLAAPLLIQRPTVSIEMDGRRHRPRILRGIRLSHGSVANGKIGQYERLMARNVPVPEWTEITPETSLDPAIWGPYVVVKPSRGKRGAYVRISRTGRVRYRRPEDFPDGHLGRTGPMLAQRFVYTGCWPVSYRVLTYFGVPVASVRYDGRQDKAPLNGPDDFKAAGGGLSIVASAKGSSITLSAEAEVLDLARRAHGAFPLWPSLGIDIVRDDKSGTLYVLEVNPGGDTWIFTSDSGIEVQAEFGLDFYAQFGAFDAIAERSIEIVRKHAR